MDVATFVDENFGAGTELAHELATNALKEHFCCSIFQSLSLWRAFNSERTVLYDPPLLPILCTAHNRFYIAICV